MLFRSSLFSAAWDTWMYYADGKYYLYYLITETSPGEGFGVAVSDDGVHFSDCGMQLRASSQMEFYLGTGSVWRQLPWNGTYLCNFSEWRRQGEQRQQHIYFAASQDLIHWKKLDEKYALHIDPDYYRTNEHEAARWDCINTLRVADGYLGYWTARPHEHPGIGFGRSKNGLNWESLPPPEIDLSQIGQRELESGSVMEADGRYYMLIGCYDHPGGVCVMVSDSPSGPFTLQKKSSFLFANQERVQGYFARSFEAREQMLVNFHVLLREQNAHGRHYTYMAPLKAVEIDRDGTLRLTWWQGNDALLGERCGGLTDACIAETSIGSTGGDIVFQLQNGVMVTLHINCRKGSAALRSQAGQCLASIERDLEANRGNVRILMRGTMMEWYLDDSYMFCYTFSAEPERLCAEAPLQYYRMA